MSPTLLKRLGGLHLALIALFLWLPLAVMVAMGFNDSPLYALPFEPSLRWYRALAGNQRMLAAVATSLWLAVLVALLSTLVGSLAALALPRVRPGLAATLRLALLPPIAVPWLILGLALLLLSTGLGLGRGLLPVLLAHGAVALPYTVLITATRLAALDPAEAEAAATLGAAPIRVWWRILLPRLAPGLIGAALTSFALSFDQYILSHLLAGSRLEVLPVRIFAAIRTGYTPEINAVGSLVLLVSAAAFIGAALALRPRP